MAQNITLLGASYSNVPAVQLPKTGGGTAKFTDTTPTTASASDVASGKIFFDASGTQQTGSASGGGGNEFLVTFTKSGQSWVPDKTFSQTFSAYTNGKTICSVASDYSSSSIVYDDDNDGFYVVIEEGFNDFDGSQYYNWGVHMYAYIWTSEGFDEDENSTYYATDLGTAIPSDVASGKVFYNTTGIQIGTASGGGGSVPYPTFNVTWSNDWSSIVSVTCDKTYQYCYDLYTNDYDARAVTIEHDQANTETQYNAGSVDNISVNYDIKYVIVGGAYPYYDLIYHPNGTISATYPSSKLISVTPTATKGTVSTHSITVTPSVTVPSSGGFVSGGTSTGTPVTVTASELVAGTILWCDDPGYWNVTDAETFVVAEGTAGTPTATKGTVSNHTINVTPSVTNTGGWITGGTKTGTAVSVSASELVSGNLAISQNGTNIDVSNYATVSVNVSGGSSKNAQAHQSTTRATSSSYTSCNSFTCTKAGTYTVYWSTARTSTSGTWGSQLYINGTAYGTAQTGSWSNHVQNIKLTGVSIGANQSVAVYARSRGSNYYAYVPLVTIIEE